jgi:soluble lytic murein transglycosylase
MASTSYADVYKYTDENGVIHFTDIPHANAKKIKTVKRENKTSDKNYESIINKAADKYRIDPMLIKAIIAAESNFNARAVSKKGAMGLMQLMPSTAVAMGVLNPFNPEENIEGGIRYLKHLLEKFDGDLNLALAAYNAGPTNVKKYGNVPPIKETQNYIKKVYSFYKGSKRIPQPSKHRTVIYKIVLKDGTILFTNSGFYRKKPSRL